MNKKSSIAYLLFAIEFLSLSCKRDVMSFSQKDTLTQSAVDVCPPFLQKIAMNLTQKTSDSAFLQLPCVATPTEKIKKFPLLIFFHGLREGSKYAPLNRMLYMAVPKYLADSIRFTFSAVGEVHHMIMLCPQSYNGFCSPLNVNRIINYMVAHYPVDTSRIYLTGVSAGATTVLNYLTHLPEYPKRIAAAVPMSPVWIDSTHYTQLPYISQANVRMIVICGDRDTRIFSYNKRLTATINQGKLGLAWFMAYAGGHGPWNQFYFPGHNYYNPNLYEWLLQYKRD